MVFIRPEASHGVAAVLLTTSVLLLYWSSYSSFRTPPSTGIYSSGLTEVWKNPIDVQTNEQRTSAVCLEGVVTVTPGGRLGNQILEYASAAAVAHRHRLRLAMPTALLQHLSTVFHGLSAVPLRHLLQQPPCRSRNLTEEQLLQDSMYQLQRNASVDEKVHWAMNRRYPVVLQIWIVLPEYIASSLEYLREELHFQPKLQQEADKKLSSVKRKTAVRHGCNQTGVCTVGVHVRRTDYTEYMKRVFHLQQEAGVEYYTAAARAMLQDLKDACCAVAFVVTSDDSSWCRNSLLPELQRISRSEEPPSSTFIMSSGKAESDLCLLASCQHTIMAYGTFGLTVAILAGGRTIMYDTARHGASKLPAAQIMTSLVDQWRLLP